MTIKQKQCFKCKQTVYENDAIQISRKDGSGTFAQKFNEVQCINPHFKTCGKEDLGQEPTTIAHGMTSVPSPLTAEITQSKSTAQGLVTPASNLNNNTEVLQAINAISITLTDLTNTVELIAKKVGVNLPQ